MKRIEPSLRLSMPREQSEFWLMVELDLALVSATSCRQTGWGMAG
jgi:hypothetical protein